ncbi:MAG TPA: hypothetical protein VEH04_00490 [Verrucomicrobiae bacterium]|nr:hypothetical protein [Verrucomicrobiae bacterium]
MRLLLACSVGLSACLAALALHHERPVRTERSTIANAQVQGTISPAAQRVVAVVLTNRFHWSQVESTNYLEFVSNLRSIRCPERTVADILRGEVNEEYRIREEALTLEIPFWAAGRQRREAERRNRQQRRILAEERARIFQETGIEDRSADFQEDRIVGYALVRFLLGPATDEKVQQLIACMDRFSRWSDEFHERTGGVWTTEDKHESGVLNDRFVRELGNLLSPLELQEFKARAATLDWWGNSIVAEAVSLNPLEFRQMALLKAEGTAFSGWFGLEAEADPVEDAARESAFTNGVASLLGPERFTAFVRASDERFSPIHEFAKEHALPQETAVQLYEVRKLAAEERERIKAAGAVDNEASRERMAQIESEVREAAATLLSSEAFEQFLESGASWVTNASDL